MPPVSRFNLCPYMALVFGFGITSHTRHRIASISRYFLFIFWVAPKLKLALLPEKHFLCADLDFWPSLFLNHCAVTKNYKLLCLLKVNWIWRKTNIAWKVTGILYAFPFCSLKLTGTTVDFLFFLIHSLFLK